MGPLATLLHVERPRAMSEIWAAETNPLFRAPRDLLEVVTTKLVQPQAPAGAIPRPRVLEKLTQPPDARIALIAAAAGYGKTSVLVQWADTDTRPVAWVTLGPTDSDVVRFWSYVVAAVRTIVPDLTMERSPLPTSVTDSMLPKVVNAISSVDSGVLMILDDYHEIASSEVDNAVERLIRRIPDGSCLAIASRRSPQLSLARWRAAEAMIDVRQTDLKFSDQEAKAWLHARGADLDAKSIKTSIEVTEGWPAAYALFMGSILSSDEPEIALRDLRGDLRHIAEYISDEVVTSLNGDDRRTLRAAAICQEVSGSLIDAMLETSDSAQNLIRLSQADVLLEPIDETGELFRLHRLVAEFLQGDISSDERERLSSRAAGWFIAHERPREALEMTFLSGNHRHAVEMINRTWPAHMLLGQVETLKRDMARVSRTEGSTNSTFLVTQAWVYAAEGRRSDAKELLRQARKHDDGRPLPDGCPSVEAAAELISALFMLEGINRGWENAERADALIDDTSPFRPVAELAVAASALARGNLRVARSRYSRVLTAGEPLLQAQAIGWLALIDVLEGDTQSARLRLDDARPIYDQYPRVASNPTIVTARAALALAEGRPLECANHLVECLDALGTDDPAMRLEILTWLAGAEAVVGRAQRANETILQGRLVAETLGGSAWHTERLDEISEQLGAERSVVGIDPGLTDREVRILQLLAATHLSQRDIGRELDIAFNTVKSHVKSIYVKIGASSREEASQISKARGLI